MLNWRKFQISKNSLEIISRYVTKILIVYQNNPILDPETKMKKTQMLKCNEMNIFEIWTGLPVFFFVEGSETPQETELDLNYSIQLID